MEPTHTCIWCKRNKPESEFNTEHVLPQAFGTFEENPTLINVVCEACNTFFANNHDLWLARDTLEGFDRYRYGLKPASEFKSLGPKSTARIQIPDGPIAGAWAFTIPGDHELGMRLFPQIGVSRSEAGPYEWYLLDQMATRDELKARGFAGEIHYRFLACENEEGDRVLRERGFDPMVTGTFQPPTGRAMIEQVFQSGLPHRRSLIKIAVNYVAARNSAAIVLEPRFDAMRALVMDGIEPDHKYWDVDQNPIVEADKGEHGRLYGHIIVTHQRGDDVEAIVSMFNRFRHGFHLSWDPGSPIKARGDFFDVSNRVLHPMFPS